MLVKRISSHEIIDISLSNCIYSKQLTKEVNDLNISLGQNSARMIELAYEDLRDKKLDDVSESKDVFKEENYEFLG